MLGKLRSKWYAEAESEGGAKWKVVDYGVAGEARVLASGLTEAQARSISALEDLVDVVERCARGEWTQVNSMRARGALRAAGRR